MFSFVSEILTSFATAAALASAPASATDPNSICAMHESEASASDSSQEQHTNAANAMTDCSAVWDDADIRTCTAGHPTPPTPYTCDSTTNKCTCVGVADCLDLKDSGECYVPPGGQSSLNCGLFSCTCQWH